MSLSCSSLAFTSADAVHVMMMSEQSECCITECFSTKKPFVDRVICSQDVCEVKSSGDVARRHIKVGLHVQVRTLMDDFCRLPSHAPESANAVGMKQSFY